MLINIYLAHFSLTATGQDLFNNILAVYTLLDLKIN